MNSCVRLVSTTSPSMEGVHTAEELIAYCARVSSPTQLNKNIKKLLRYCVEHGHWSIFEMADMTVEINTTRGIAPQILRHRSFSFQEFSQRYAAVDVSNSPIMQARAQDPLDRQNSTDSCPVALKSWFDDAQLQVNTLAATLYKEALDQGIAKECARFLLPLSTPTRLYMKGSVRSWIHYLQVRAQPSTQLEHQTIALQIMEVFKNEFPVTFDALFNNVNVTIG